ncbi:MULTISPECIES: signal peptidase I [unclassified Halorubrum]|uniref:signal peptidase I n=1 Tax=unclassified Halorubrum TaxID=2642239 RepID=UPI0010F93B20|nr:MULTISPECIES: signal peptidase I [unclassified Halorubrum]TKX45034.1 signal peptidase I [Halorubrum sp. ARQ200]TKX48820.1 signal peptidase I [Halorubrum sp. ASP121]
MTRETVRDAITVVSVLVVVAVVAGQLAGQPVLLGYVTSGSMAPTLEAGDGFVAVPAAVSGPVEEGDVVVFEAIELDGGGTTTHRVVGSTPDGYLTKGDNNPFRDQDGDEPPVTEDRIVATALQVNGEVVRIPGLGTAITGVRDAAGGVAAGAAGAVGLDWSPDGRGLSGLFIAVGLALLLFILADDLRKAGRRIRSRDRSRGDDGLDARWVVLLVALLILVPANAAMIAPSGTHHVTVDGDDLPAGTLPGDEVENEFIAENNGLITMLVVLETAHPESEFDRTQLAVPRGESVTATLSTTAPEPGERATVAVSEHRYFLVVPPSLILRLHSIHPAVAVGAFNLLVLGSVVTLLGALVGSGSGRVREPRRGASLSVQLRRLFK